VSVGRWFLFAAVAAGCSGDDEVRACETGPATCDSSLIVNLPDPRTEFTLTLTDTEGMDILVDCPAQDTGLAGDGTYSWVCGQGRATINTWKPFGDTVTVRLGASPERDFQPDYQRGGDFCGNVCTQGSIQL
jgi:hypothetical protein